MFEARTVIITGAARGIGRSLAQKLCERGAVVHAWDMDEAGLAELGELGKKHGWELITTQVDVTKLISVEKALKAISESRSPAIDYWINNAGVAGICGFADQKPSDFRGVMDVNFNSVVQASRLAVEHMENTGKGVIVNMASVAGHLAAPYLSAYTASKHAVVGFTRAIREELRLQASPVRIVLVSPGFVDTGMIKKGGEFGFPDWLSWALGDTDSVAVEIIKGLEKGREELFPTWNGRLMLRLFRLFPQTTSRQAKMLLTRSFKDWLLNRFTYA